MKQKLWSQGIEVRDRWERDPRESPGKGSWLLLFVVVSCSLLLATGYAAGYWPPMLLATGRWLLLARAAIATGYVHLLRALA